MPYTHKKVGDKYVVYKGGKKVGSTKGTKAALDKYLAALHINADKKESVKESITMQQPVMQQMPQQMPSHEHPGCEDKVGQICVVMKPGPEDSPADIVHPTHVFGMGQFDPAGIHGVYHDEEEANQIAESMCREMYENMRALEEKKEAVSGKIQTMISKLQRQVNQHMKAADENPQQADMHQQKAQAILAKIGELRHKHGAVQASKKEVKPLDEEK